MEQYVWGMGETTGTGPKEHTKVMTTMFRTYGYWYTQYATKYLTYGFRIKSDSGSQIYRGYDWEVKYPKIKEMAEATRAKMVFYDKEVALTPYSSWTDGKTRSFKERWGSSDYPWCQSVKDPYGKHPSMSTKELEAAGNHMVGLSAHGSLELADDHNWKYDKILHYYYDDVDIKTVY
jgi:SpoIID/LytB domain protein